MEDFYKNLWHSELSTRDIIRIDLLLYAHSSTPYSFVKKFYLEKAKRCVGILNTLLIL